MTPGTIANSGFLNSTTNNLSYTVPAGHDFLAIAIYSTIDNVTAVTYNSVSCTLVQKLLMTGAAAGQYIHLYQIASPTVGTANITVTSSTGLAGYISGLSYSGVDTASPIGASATNGSSSTASLTTSVTTTTDNSWLIGFAYTGNTMSAGAGTTLRGGAVAGILSMIDSNGAKTPTGSHSLIVTQTASFAGAIVAELKPASGPAPTPSRLMMMGVGS
jgi:hypothetical protein